jgi:hypothetical protein
MGYEKTRAPDSILGDRANPVLRDSAVDPMGESMAALVFSANYTPGRIGICPNRDCMNL